MQILKGLFLFFLISLGSVAHTKERKRGDEEMIPLTPEERRKEREDAEKEIQERNERRNREFLESRAAWRVLNDPRSSSKDTNEAIETIIKNSKNKDKI